MSVIARNVFGLPNTADKSASSLGSALRPQIKQNERGGEIIANRTRPFAYTFRATDKERQIIDEKIKQSGITMTEFVIRAIKDKPITVIENASEILAELKRQGNNLNQAVRNNYYGIETERELKGCIAELKNLYRKIANIVGGV